MALRRALVLGGAGFIGSAVCRHFFERGWEVTCVDGLLARTTSEHEGFQRVPADIRQIEKRIDDTESALEVMQDADLVVDAIGWTSHWGALDDPFYDMSLNLRPHIALSQALKSAAPHLFVYLGSRHQYGRVEEDDMDESAPFRPVDVQGIHKSAADEHLRLAAKDTNAAIVSLRFGNTFGPGQPVRGPDVGLLGDFMRRAIVGDTLKVYGTARRRTLHYAPDLAAIIEAIGQAKPVCGYTPLNVPGENIGIADLARLIVDNAGAGTVEAEPLSPDVASIDVGDRAFDSSRLDALCGPITLTPLSEAVRTTINDVRMRLGCGKNTAS